MPTERVDQDKENRPEPLEPAVEQDEPDKDQGDALEGHPDHGRGRAAPGS